MNMHKVIHYNNYYAIDVLFAEVSHYYSNHATF